MNQWAFVIAAYVVVIAASVLLVGVSAIAMRRAESAAARLGREQ